MKKLLLSAFFLLAITSFSRSQVMVDSVDINKLNIQYIEIYSASSIGGSVRINYGQTDSGLTFNFDALVDPESGKPFRNNIAALNFLYKNGWELIVPKVKTGDEAVASFLLQRRDN